VTVRVNDLVVVNNPSVAVMVIVVVPERPARGAIRIWRLVPLLSGNVIPELKTTLAFDDVADNETPDAPESASPTLKLIARAVLRGVEYDDPIPAMAGGVSMTMTRDADV
jgi:hypothetical protein